MSLFTLATAGHFYKKDQAEKLEKLGFTFTETETEVKETGKKELCISSDRVEIKIDTLDELLSFAKEYGNLVIGADGDQPSILVYDDYLE